MLKSSSGRTLALPLTSCAHGYKSLPLFLSVSSSSVKWGQSVCFGGLMGPKAALGRHLK